MNNGKILALLVDDHSLILQGLKYIILQMPEIDEVYTASTASEALDLIDEKTFQICILDIELPDMTGFDLVDKIKVVQPAIKIIINTMHEEYWMVKRMIASGVEGVVLKSADTDELVKAIKEVLSNKTYFCDEFIKIKKRIKMSSESSVIDDNLTHRELEVLMAISKGLQTREIADLLHVSINTVESHRKNLFFKLGVRNSVELVMKAMKKGLIYLD